MSLRKLLVGFFVMTFTAGVVNAYTVVMRSGRQVEIPNTFTVTKSTLTYETAPGIQITIQMATIDVAATERLNKQPGSLSLNAPKPVTAAPVQQPTTKARRSVTNQDLEVYRRARLEQEQQRKDLGLPSAEERRKETEAIEDRTQEQVQAIRSREELDFWRNRAVQLETQLVTTAAQVNNAPNQGYDIPWGYPYGVVTTGFPFGVPIDGFGVDGFRGFNKFNNFPNFGFNKFPFNNFNRFPGGFRGRLLFTTPQPRGRAQMPNIGRPGGHGGGRGGSGRR